MTAATAPTPRPLRTVLLTLRDILSGGIRIVVWDSLKHGFIDIRPLPRVPRLLALVGFVFVFAFIASIVFNDALRFSGELEPLPLASTSARALFVPSTAVPLAFIAVILAWTFLFTGALHTRALMRWGTVIVFALFALPNVLLGSLQSSPVANSPLLITIGISIAAVLGLVVVFLVLPRFRLPLALEFGLMLLFVGAMYISSFYASAVASRHSYIDFVSGYLTEDVVTSPFVLIIPFWYFAGAEVINFGIEATSWVAGAVKKYSVRWMILGLLGALLAYRWIDFIAFRLLPGVSTPQALAWAGAGLAGICLIPIAFWRARQPFGDHVPLKLIIGLIVGLILVQFLILPFAYIAAGYLLAQKLAPAMLSDFDQATQPLLGLSRAYGAIYFLLVALAGAIVAVVGIARKRYTVAAFGMILAWTQFVWWFMEHGRPLQALRYHYGDLDIFIVLALSGVALYWAWKKELSTERALRLFGLAFFGWMLNNTDLLDSPLGTLFGLFGLSFTVFGIFWSVITAGGKFANFDSPQFPHISRIILYLGYVLITVNLTHWYLVTHNVAQQAINSNFTASGLRVYGLTLAYLVFVEGGKVWTKSDTVKG